jgi:deferrochelatase/peroxidase EfeB
MRRRQFLTTGAALGAGVALERVAGARSTDTAQAAPAGTAAPGLRDRVPFEGEHQAGILTPRPQQAIFVALDAIAPSRAELAAGLQALSDHARRTTAGYRVLLGAPGEGPTPDTGVLGPTAPPDGLTVTVGFGASLFDDRYGLARRAPSGLKPMETFPDDDLDPAQTHGDVLLQLNANTQETLLNALRELLRAARPAFAVRWKVEGFLPVPRETGARRNLLGFKDGTSNPDPADAAEMRRLVWVAGRTGSQAWTNGGTFQVARIIRNRVEFWDRVARSEQELMIGRTKDTGAPLGRAREQDDPGLAGDPKGERIPLDAHIRLARPRDPATESQRILRRPFNYSRGVDESGQLDMGLMFVSYQRSIARQFEAVQKRLAGEPLVDYVKPVGGGYFFVPPGARDADDWVGSGLFL